ncbi:MAG: hypothetical protein KBA95_13210 [Acidobacteria bacterium]|nr:hypothetical protein [Acidobacteriota bacterium]
MPTTRIDVSDQIQQLERLRAGVKAMPWAIRGLVSQEDTGAYELLELAEQLAWLVTSGDPETGAFSQILEDLRQTTGQRPAVAR